MDLKDIQYKIEDLELRKKIEGHRPFIFLGLLFVIVLCLGLAVCQLTGGRSNASRKAELVYFDLSSQTIRIVEHQYPATPASPLPGTTDVFLARVYACEDCPEGVIKDGMTTADLESNGLFIGYLERYAPEPEEKPLMYAGGASYRALDNDQWHELASQGYDQLIADVYKRCPKAKMCHP